MAFIAEDIPFNKGEEHLHNLLHVPGRENPTSAFLTPGAAIMTTQAPLMAIGALDSAGRPWTSVWGGEPGFAGPLGKLGTARGNLLVIKAKIDRKYDPVAEILAAGDFKKPGDGVMVSALPIDLEKRTRVKIFGRELAGQFADLDEDEKDENVGQIQMIVNIEQSLGNCPKYLNKKHIIPCMPNAKLFSASPFLPAEAIEVIEKADMFFMSTANGDIDMDTNHRGGPPGFVRILSNSPTGGKGAVIVYPEYSGNRLYQSLGNLVNSPQIGICIPDFDTGDVLYATGMTEILTGADSQAVIPHTNLSVKITITEARFVLNGLPFRGEQGEPSPYNPPVRKLAAEGALDLESTEKPITASLVERTDSSPSISRYRFKTSEPIKYKAGQWVALDFSAELDQGYSHMRDSDPQSLNDDFVRTFTISSPPASLPDDEFEITVRLHGPVTNYLKKLKGREFSELTLQVRGIGGDFSILPESASDDVIPFIAGGVGITPLLATLSSSQLSRVRLLWTTPWADALFVESILSQYPDLAKHTTLFLTSGHSKEHAEEIEKLGTTVHTRRLSQKDILDLEESVKAEGSKIDRWTLCAGTLLKKDLLNWLSGKQVEYEDFNF